MYVALRFSLPAVGCGTGQVAAWLSFTLRWPVGTERLFVWADNFEPESIDPYKPGTIEVKKEGDRKVTTVERASTVVSPTRPPNISSFYTGIVRWASAYDSTTSQGRGSYLPGQRWQRRMWIACWCMTRISGYVCCPCCRVPDQRLKPVPCFCCTDLHVGEAGLSD